MKILSEREQCRGGELRKAHLLTPVILIWWKLLPFGFCCTFKHFIEIYDFLVIYLYFWINGWAPREEADPFPQWLLNFCWYDSSPPPITFLFIVRTVACGILAPPLRTEPRPLAVKAWVCPCTTREFPITFKSRNSRMQRHIFLHWYSEFPKELEDYK